MAALTQEMKDMIASQQCFIATVDQSGTPNVGPKRSTRVLNDNSLIFNEGTGGATYKNIQDGSKVAIAVVNGETFNGYRFLGKPEIITSGELYDKAAEMSVKRNLPKPHAVIVVPIEEIHSLKPGKNAGKKINDWVLLSVKFSYLSYCKGLIYNSEKLPFLFRYCIKPSHVYFITYSEKGELSDILRDFKSFTSKQVLKAIEENPKESKLYLLQSCWGGLCKYPTRMEIKQCQWAEPN